MGVVDTKSLSSTVMHFIMYEWFLVISYDSGTWFWGNFLSSEVTLLWSCVFLLAIPYYCRSLVIQSFVNLSVVLHLFAKHGFRDWSPYLRSIHIFDIDGISLRIFPSHEFRMKGVARCIFIQRSVHSWSAVGIRVVCPSASSAAAVQVASHASQW